MSYNTVVVASDFHRSPFMPIAEADRKLFQLAADMNAPLIINDDLLDLIIFGLDNYTDSPVVKSIKEHIPPRGVYLTLGNHSVRVNWLKRVFGDTQNVWIAKTWDIEVGGRMWHFEHGDGFSVDWGPLRPLYTGIAEVFLHIYPELWCYISKKCGWVPSVYKNGVEGENQQYATATWAVWARAVRYAIKHWINVAVGHTHQAIVLPIYRGLQMLQMADSGDFKTDGSFLIINEQGARVEWIDAV